MIARNGAPETRFAGKRYTARSPPQRTMVSYELYFRLFTSDASRQVKVPTIQDCERNNALSAPCEETSVRFCPSWTG